MEAPGFPGVGSSKSVAGLSQENPLKDVFNPGVTRDLSRRIKSVYPRFDSARFERETIAALPDLGFLERSHHLREMLRKYLPDDYPRAIKILIATLGDEITPGVTVWENFHIIALCSFVAHYGKEHYDLSMRALYEFTRRFSAEGDLRTFLEVDYKRTMALLGQWTRDPSPHVRRLVSEGTRPRLPLAPRIERFVRDPRPVIRLLEQLKDDPELYVRRSVANNINDIAKDHPDLAVKTLKKWSKSKSKDVQWVVKHAARSLVKQGHPGILEVLGVSTAAKVKVGSVALRPRKQTYRLGDEFLIEFEIQSRESGEVRLVVDYVVDYVKAGDKRAEKVFKLRELNLGPGEKRTLSKKHRLKDTAGRKHYAGTHGIELQINGKRYRGAKFDLRP